MKSFLCLYFLFFSIHTFPQTENSTADPAAANLLKKVSAKYTAYKNILAEFDLIIQRPKLKPEEDERKYADTLKGKIILEGNQFNISIKGQQIVCDGKNIWTYIPSDKEVQVNYYEENDDVFSPSKIFTLYKEGSLYDIKEKKVVKGKKETVIEMSPSNKNVSYFKMEVGIYDATSQIAESKLYEKNGVHYIYKITKQTPNIKPHENTFTFDVKKYPGVKVVDLR